MRKTIIIFILILLILIGCSSNDDTNGRTEITVSAAASLTESLIQLNEAFEKEHPEIKVSYNYGGSGSLRKQIEQGAPIDIFLSASNVDYEKLVEQERVEKGTAFLTNQLVLITRKEIDLDSLEMFMDGEGLIAIGTPEVVPAGTYGKEVLGNLNVWNTLEEQKRLVPTKDVTQVLTLVKDKAVEVGIVYESDVFHEQDVKILEEFDVRLHSPIDYFAAIIDNQEDKDAKILAKEVFYEFISSESAIEIFEENGFSSVE